MHEPLTTVSSSRLVLPQPNIDTDQIIPARFLTTTTRHGLGAHAFADWRDTPPLDDPRAADCAVLVAGDNFGCGSSREHAAWALHDFGIRAVISTTIADIFRANAIQNGIVPIEVAPKTHAALLARPWEPVELDLPSRRIRFDGAEIEFTIDAFGAHCLAHGLDTLDYLLSQSNDITAFEAARA